MLTTVKPTIPRQIDLPSDGSSEGSLAARARSATLTGSSWNQLMDLRLSVEAHLSESPRMRLLACEGNH